MYMYANQLHVHVTTLQGTDVPTRTLYMYVQVFPHLTLLCIALSPGPSHCYTSWAMGGAWGMRLTSYMHVLYMQFVKTTYTLTLCNIMPWLALLDVFLCETERQRQHTRPRAKKLRF